MTFGFTGQQTDSTGLQYLRARYYSPANGTFLTTDPVLGVIGGPASTFNPYSYVRGNTVNLTDPSGKIAPLVLPLALNALLGGIAADVFAGDGQETARLAAGLMSGCLSDVVNRAWALMQPGLEALAKTAIAFVASTIAGAVTTAATFALASAAGVTSAAALIVGAAALFVGGITSGQTFRATTNVLNGQNWDKGLFNGQDMLIDGAVSVISFGIFSKFAGGGITTFGAEGLKAGRQTVSSAKNLFGKGAEPNNQIMGGSNNLSNPSKNIGFGLLANRPIRPTQKGLEIIKKHLSNPFFDDFDGRNTLMINRIQNSIDAGAWLRDADAIFYTHEISEYTIMNGVYDLTTYNIAHQAAIAKYQVSDYAIYAREIIELFPKNFNPAYHKFWNINP